MYLMGFHCIGEISIWTCYGCRAVRLHINVRYKLRYINNIVKVHFDK